MPSPNETSTSSPALQAPVESASLPNRWSAREIGERILMAPGPDGTLFVSIPGADGSAIQRFDHTGRAHPGWPIVVQNSTACGLLLPVSDGSVRVVCDATNLPQPEWDLQTYAPLHTMRMAG